MVCVRGINVFPEKVEEVLLSFEGVGPGYSLVTQGKRGMNNHLTLRVEASPGILQGREEEKTSLRQKIQLAFRRAAGIGVEIEFVKEP
jgi:phenylacetate-CoA ligase